MLEEGLDLQSEITVATHDKPPANLPVDMTGTPYVEQPEYQMGWEAAETLLNHIGNAEAPIVQKILRSKLIMPKDIVDR